MTLSGVPNIRFLFQHSGIELFLVGKLLQGDRTRKSVNDVARMKKHILKHSHAALNRRDDLFSHIGRGIECGVTHHGERWLLAVRILCARLIQALSVELYFCNRFGQWPRNDVAVVFDCVIEGNRRSGSNPDRRMRFLQGLWHRSGGGNDQNSPLCS